MTVPRLRRHRWRAQRRLLALIATGWLVAGLALPGSPGAGAYPVAARTPTGPTLTWTAEQPATHPPALAYASAVYDSDNQTVVLFGGVDAQGDLSDDTWVWNGSTWTDHPGSKILAPPAREMASMAFDPKLHQLILFGGLGAAGVLSDTWAWNGASWTEQPSSSPPPPARESAAMAYDGSLNLVLFGGLGGPANQTGPASSTTSTTATSSTSSGVASTVSAASPVALDDTWLWTKSGWVESTATGPSARSGASFAYDSSAHEAVLFGGTTAVTGSPRPGSGRHVDVDRIGVETGGYSSQPQSP